jgi:hypothetical protein
MVGFLPSPGADRDHISTSPTSSGLPASTRVATCGFPGLDQRPGNRDGLWKALRQVLVPASTFTDTKIGTSDPAATRRPGIVRIVTEVSYGNDLGHRA